MHEPFRRNAQARRLFDGIAHSYEAPARVLSLFQYSRWHRYLVSRLRLRDGDVVLDVCTGTGLVAAQIAGSGGCRVVGVDLSPRMLDHGLQLLRADRHGAQVSLAAGLAERLPFSDNSFDAVVFTFLFRYVEDPQATLCEMARVLRPGGRMTSLEFAVPTGPVLHPLWLLHTRLVIPIVGRLLSPAWREVGSFLGPSISAFYRKHTLKDLRLMWQTAGFVDVHTKLLSLGGAVVMWGDKEAHGED